VGEAIPAIDVPLADGDRVELLGITFDVLAVPGHTRGHIAYHAPSIEVLFCGDTLFAGGCGRLFEGTPAQMSASLARLARLPDATRVYCAHEYTVANLRFALAVEPDNAALARRLADCERLRARDVPTVPSTIALERATNPFLRCDEPAVRAVAERRRPGAGVSTVETFAAIRAWKDIY
jgi:hydroxyacylglutathione hydrolase